MSQLFDRLGYNFPSGNGIIDFSNTTKQTLDNLSNTAPLLDPWAFDALKNDDVASVSYLQNPVANIVNSIISVCESIDTATGNVGDFATLRSACQNIAGYTINTGTEEDPVLVEIEGTGEAFFAHTERISGRAEINQQTVLLPHYDTALSVGKSVMYLINQSDGIVNNSPVMGSFTSILIRDELSESLNVIVGYPSIISGSITCTIIGEEEVCTTSLTAGQISAITANVTNIDTTFVERRLHDENFFNNAKTLMSDYDKISRFKDMGESERNLTQNFVGTSKLLANTSPNV